MYNSVPYILASSGSISHVRDRANVSQGADSLIDSGLSTAGHSSLKGDVRVGVDWVNLGAFASQRSANVSEHCIRVAGDWEHEASDNPMSIKGKLAEHVRFWSEVIQALA